MPIRKSDNSGLRWMRITARTAHLISISLYVGGAWFGVADLQLYLVAVVISGALLMALFFNKNANWLLEHRGLVIMAKLLMVAQLGWIDEPGYLLLFIILISSLVSHAPGSVRYASFFLKK